MRPTYATREDVKSALDVRETARANQRIDRYLEAASDQVDSLCHRVFYPHLTTRYFDWPDPNRSRAWRLWFNQHSVISLSDLGVRGGASISPSAYLLEPVNSGPPYTHVEIDTSISASGSFGGGVGNQRGVRVTGMFGYKNTYDRAGSLAAGMTLADTVATVSDSSVIGVGSTLIIGTERVIVSGRTQASTGATLTAPLTASLADQGVQVSDGSKVAVGEQILVDTERMIVDDKAGNTLIVRRGVDGSVLSVHSSAVVVYAPRLLTVQRAAVGTTATVHNDLDAVSVVTYPGLVRSLTIAESLAMVSQDGAAWARVIGGEDNQREVMGRGLTQLRDDCYWAHGRQARKMAI